MIKKSLSFFVNQSMRLYAEVKNNVSCVLSATDRKIKLIASLRITSLILGGVLTLHAITKIASPNLIVTVAKISVAALLVLFGLTGSVSKVSKSNQPKREPMSVPVVPVKDLEPMSVPVPVQELEPMSVPEPKLEPEAIAVLAPKQRNILEAEISLSEIRSQQELSEEQIIELGKEIAILTYDNLNATHIKDFLKLGGKINYVQEGAFTNKIPLKKEGVTYYIGCSAGRNCSTATYGFLHREFNITPVGVFAGHTSVFNPFGSLHGPNQPDYEEKEVFKAVYDIEKPSVLGDQFDFRFYENLDATNKQEGTEEFYENIVENFPRSTHIIAFSETFSSTIARLLRSKRAKSHQEKPLTGITITFVNWKDTIRHPSLDPDTNQTPNVESVEAFEIFNKKLAKVFFLE